MIQRLSKRFLSMLLVTVMILGLVPVIAAPAFAATSGTLTGLTDENIGLSFTGDADNAWSANGKTIIGSVKTEGDICGDTVYSSKLTITNNKGAKATLAFDYAVEQNSGTITVGGTDVTANSSYSAELDPGASTTVYIKSGSTSDATKITITNISLVSDVPVAVTFVPAENGTYAVDGKTITEAWENTQKATQAYKLVATPNDGYMFFGWYNVTNGKCMSTDASVELKIESDCSFAAKFVPKGTALFETGGQPFAYLNEAVNYAVANSKNKITLIADGAISGNYDIPAGITLLIPFDDAGTLYTDSPAAIRTTPASKPFRTLTMAAGSSITVNGAISIGGRYFAAGGGQQGRPTGDHGYIKMASGSSITVKNGGNLYAWGFISGDGSVTAESGATVYEFYQIADFRGGNASSNMGNKVFPFSQYFIQNIEVPLTLNAGATEKVFSGVYAMSTTYTTTINFIGSGGMFNIKSGSFTKDYDESTDRLILSVNGEAKLNVLALTLAGFDVNSADYVLPMMNNITINIDSGSVTINQDTALLAGVEVNIAEGAGLTVASGKNVYVYDADEWNAESYVCGSSKFKSVSYAPGKKYSRSNADLVDAKVTVNGTLTVNGAMYTTAGGADICSDGTGKYVQNATPGTEKVTYQYTQSGSSVTAHEITITSAKLRNADGTYFKTATVEAGTTVNYYKDGGIWHVHTAVDVPAKEATCTEKGNTAGTKCSVCNKILSGVEEIPAKGHQWDEGSITTAPTCTEDGVKTFTCLVCDGTKTEKVEKKGHISAEAVRENEIKSTCTVKGSYDEVVYCKECGKELSRVTKTIDALGHTPGEAKRENVVEPSCMVDGRYEEVVYCSVCNDEISRVNKTIDATGHTPVEVPEVPATCTKPGTAAGTKCDVCGEELSGFEVIPPAGHQWDEGVVTKEPTCAAEGEKTFTCTVCKETKTEKIDKTNDHTPGEAQRENVKEATCTKDGSYDEVVRCKVCNKELSREPKTITSPGHQWDDGVVTTEPKCEEAGVKTYTCKVCKETKTEAIDATGHTPVEVPEVPATCTEPGKTAGTKCGVCGDELSGFEVIPPAGHQWDEGKVTTEPTCEGTGVKTFTCSNCQEKRYEDIPATGHQWDEGKVTTEPKCEEAGVKTYTCKVCKETKTEAIDATGHTPVEVPEVPATCTEPGKKAGTKCSVCNKILSGVEEIPAKGHTPGKAVKESVVLATCEAAGSYEEVVYCEVCKEKLTRVSKTLPAMGHTRGEAVRENVIDSTCADEGSCDEVVYCEVCKKELSREAKVIEKKAHTPVDVAEVPATCTEPGTTAGTKCDVCGTILSGVKEIPANGHTEVIRNAKPATDTEDGYTGDVYCEVCNELLRNGEVIPATHVKITWIINGVKHETVCAKGEIPVYDGETPAKPETSRFTYEFKGWDKEIVAATENAEYTAEFTAIGKNGLCIEGNDTFWIKNGVNIAFPGLIRIADENGHIHYYYFAEDGKAVKNGNYKVNKNNGLPLPEYGFAFDSDGVIVHDEDTSKNGICDGDGSKFYYIDGVKVGEGLIKVGDYYYYARTSSGEIVRNRQYWITKTNELPIQQGIFDFDAEGRMIVTGFIHAFGATYYYDNGVLAKGFTKIGDDYYIFNASSGKMYSNATMWVPDNEYGITGGMYEFDADGKMIRTGFITTGGYTYYYDNGVLAKGFTKIGDDYYFFNAGSGKMYRDATLWVADNAEYGFVGGMYYFGADGKMVLPDIENGKKSIVTINGKKYLTIDGAYAPTGLYEIDGNCYYVKAAGELAVGETVWVDNKNGLIPAKGDWRAFDAEGKLIHTGFVTGGDGYVYHYTDDVLSLGFTCIDGEYYLFNAGSGKMYRDANMWVGPNDYGIVGGMYYFDANGKMAR